MAIYFGSAFGTIVGKVNGQVGCRWRGKSIIKKYTVPKDKGTILKYQQYKDGIIPPSGFSFLQFNIRRVIVNPLMFMSRHTPSFIQDVWNPEAKSRNLHVSGQNLFTRENITQLYASMDKTIEFDPNTNSPDLKQLVMSEGILEGTSELTAEYDTATGIATLTWNPNHYTNGSDSDYVSGIIVKKPILESYGRNGNWQPALAMYYTKILSTAYPNPPGLPKSRADGSGMMEIDPGLDAADLTAFVFFFHTGDIEKIISISISSVVTAPT